MTRGPGVSGEPRVLLADTGYGSTNHIDATAGGAYGVIIATGRQQHFERAADSSRSRVANIATSRERVARRLCKYARTDDARRKTTVESISGQMKTRQRAGQFRLRGLEGAPGE